MTVVTTFLVLKTLMEKALVKPLSPHNSISTMCESLLNPMTQPKQLPYLPQDGSKMLKSYRGSQISYPSRGSQPVYLTHSKKITQLVLLWRPTFALF